MSICEFRPITANSSQSGRLPAGTGRGLWNDGLNRCNNASLSAALRRSPPPSAVEGRKAAGPRCGIGGLRRFGLRLSAIPCCAGAVGRRLRGGCRRRRSWNDEDCSAAPIPGVGSTTARAVLMWRCRLRTCGCQRRDDHGRASDVSCSPEHASISNGRGVSARYRRTLARGMPIRAKQLRFCVIRTEVGTGALGALRAGPAAADFQPGHSQSGLHKA